MLLLALLMIGPSFKSEVLIKNVDRNSTSFNEGVRSGMILYELNGQKISKSQDYTNAISDLFINGETKVEIKTDSGDFTFLASNLSEINVADKPRTKIKKIKAI